jgi:hypothetical protein
MNQEYLAFTILLTLYCVIQCGTGALSISHEFTFRGFSTFILMVVSGLLLIFSGMLPVGSDIVEFKPASNTRVENELIIRADGFPTQIISDIKFIDKPVQIKKITQQNAWGGNLYTTYQVELLIKTEL